MLVLTRKVDEAVVLFSRTDAFDPIRIMVVQATGAPRVRLGFEAGGDVCVLREHLYIERFGPLKVDSAKKFIAP